MAIVRWPSFELSLDNLKRRGFWAVVFLCAVLLGPAGRVAVLAEGPEPGPSPGCALGVLDAGETVGQVTFPGTAPPPTTSVLQADEFAEEVVRLINLERDSAGLPPMPWRTYHGGAGLRRGLPVLRLGRLLHRRDDRGRLPKSCQCCGSVDGFPGTP
jgi:hypothetical protein